MNDLERFEKILAELESCRKQFEKTKKCFQTDFENELCSMYTEVYPRRKFSVERCLKEVVKSADVLVKWREKAAEVEKEYRDTEKRLVSEKDKLAESLDIPISTDLRFWRMESSTTYNSQGYGACHYAKVCAEQYAGKARCYGLVAEVREVRRCRTHGPYAIDHADYEIWVGTTEVGIHILHVKWEDISIVEWCASCWGCGVNPRVYNPFIPKKIVDEGLRLSRM